MSRQGAPARPTRPTFMRRLAGSSLAAAVGAYAGYQYAVHTLPPELHGGQLMGMYASGGAVLAVLMLRIIGMFVAIGRTYRR